MDIRIVQRGTPEYESVMDLRTRVLREPLGLRYSEADLESESKDLIIAGFEDGKAVACALLADRDGDAKMRQVAVDSSLQGRGLGRRLVDAFERLAIEKGYRRVILNARLTAVPFYLACGYEPFGEVFEEVTIPHQAMKKQLPSASSNKPNPEDLSGERA